MASTQVAVIREAECIGCTKCLAACPVDAIVGSNTYMHTVIEAECISCALCISPCPVDCIEMVEAPAHTVDKTKAKQRVKARKQRLQVNAEQAIEAHQSAKQQDHQSYIQAALARKRSYE